MKYDKLDNDMVQTILKEQEKTGRTTTEIIETLRDEGHLGLTDEEILECTMQVEWARPIWNANR